MPDLVWTTDGALVAAVPMHRWVEGPPYERNERVAVALARHGADGALEWEVDGTPGVVFTDLAATTGGGIVAGVRHDELVELTPGPGGIEWYDADGTLTESWRMTEQANGDLLHEVFKVQPLPDGGVVFAARRSSFYDYPSNTVVGLLDADRQLQWTQRIDGFAAGGGNSAADWGGVTDLALAPDGDIVVLAYYSDDVGGPLNPSPSDPTSYVLELGLDGTEHWTSLFHEGVADRLLVMPSGNLVVAGSDEGVSFASGFSLPSKLGPAPFAAELDPAGRAVGLDWIALPDALLEPGARVFVHDVAVADDDVVLTGRYFAGYSLDGYFVTVNSRDGGLVREELFPVREPSADVSSGPTVAEVAPDRRIALGGNLTGFVDLGDGEIAGGEDPVPFIAVLEPTSIEVD